MLVNFFSNIVQNDSESIIQKYDVILISEEIIALKMKW